MALYRCNEIQKNIDAVNKLMKANRHVTYRGIETSLGISNTTVHSIMYENSHVKKIFSRWIPLKKAHVNESKGTSKPVNSNITGGKTGRYLNEPEANQQLTTVWVFQGGLNPTKFVPSRITYFSSDLLSLPLHWACRNYSFKGWNNS